MGVQQMEYFMNIPRSWKDAKGREGVGRGRERNGKALRASVRTLGAAPASSSSRTHAAWPEKAALKRAVSPVCM